jgi:hypothetical protein
LIDAGGNSISSQAMEYLHRPEFLTPFVRAGFNSYSPAWDTGIDFILHKEITLGEGSDIAIKVQLKSRWSIERKYLGRNIWIAFPERPLDAYLSNSETSKHRLWYLMPHDLMVTQASKDHGSSASFIGGSYTKKKVPQNFYEKNTSYAVSNLIKHIQSHNEIESLNSLLSVWPSLS